VLASGDLQPDYISEAVRKAPNGTIVCDISAFGSSGPLANRGYSDFLIQALSGSMDTTGAPEGAPTPTRIPIMEMAAAVYATAGVLAALRVQRTQGVTQRVETALFDCAVTMLTTFLPGYFVGREPQRIGNHHPSMSPWNAFRASDGWVLMCSGSDDQWRRVCELIGCRQHATDQRYASPTSRVQVNAEVDAIVEEWTRQRTVSECIERFNTTGLACGPVYTVAELYEEPALRHRGMICAAIDPATGSEIRIPGSVFRGSWCRGHTATAVPDIGRDRSFVKNLFRARATPRPAVDAGPPRRPLEGVRVIEIGNYTTAPLAARQLAALGADVVKLEPPVGDSSRALPPHRNGQGYFFTMSNSGKRSLMLDLRSEQGKAAFRTLLEKADVLVENLKPGSLARLGFGEREIAYLNPRLVYCPISGFGSNSPYADRAAMDTTIQAMSGIMDLTRADGVPYKTGISSADLAGGQFGVVAILAALEYRDRTGRGQAIDLSMQDGAAWLTHTTWNAGAPASAMTTLVHCGDGYVAVELPVEAVERILGTEIRTNSTLAIVDAASTQREELVELFERSSIRCAPVLRVAEVVAHPQTQTRQLIVSGKSADGAEWPLVSCPIRLSATPPAVRRAIGALGADGDDVFAEWMGTTSERAGYKSVNRSIA
jgi:crotonobetainyl-CoA:carnitine CoA-transferase CaiB-like acyl-CoA transferase